MKKLIPVLMIALTSTAAFAHPGSNTLTCKSARNSGSKQNVQFELHRMNGPGWVSPEFSVSINGKKYEFKPEDETKSYGDTIHNSPLGVIMVTADNSADEAATISASFNVTAAPSTVKAFDNEGKPVKWTLRSEADECNDSNGKAVFKGVFKGYLLNRQKDSSVLNLDPQIMDCTLSYNSGMAC